ncbi:hypothetical protein LWI29_010392 [Acer saccharum]|uniref:Uncharacterized protein n=1 Tax=Acer saccharum TaxID=4024 RepID=A0AA39SYX6_ACESA|nr:hypothetical protein LWI29_010392 [Acer saccharum]
MSGTFGGGSDTEISDNLKRTLSEISEVGTIRIGVDLVSAARRNIGFLRVVNESQWLHEESNILEAIRRYDELWMPLICDLTAVGSMPPMVLPPFDVEWVWFCHTLNPVSYRQYCESRFSKVIGKPAIFDEENEEYAFMRCKEIWVQKYPSESFENEVDSDSKDPIFVNEDILSEVKKQRFLYSRFSEPYINSLMDVLILCLLLILLMWIAHLSYPTVYAEDLNDMWDDMGKAARLWGTMKAKEVEETKKSWEKTFDQPYEKAGGGLGMEFDRVASVKPPVILMVSDTDVNTKYKSMVPRFLLEVCMFLKLKSQIKATQRIQKVISYVSEWPRTCSNACQIELQMISGAMISDVILRVEQISTTRGRWLSRTVLIMQEENVSGRRILEKRRRNPSTVKWEDRITEIREGSGYVAGSIGRAPEKVVGTATPKNLQTQYQAEWFSPQEMN